MKKLIFSLACFLLINSSYTQDLKTIELLKPDKTRGLPVMQALSERASVRDWSSKQLDLKDLSDLLWAANGVNREPEGKRTAPSAQNAQDIDIYVFMTDGAYLYDAPKHVLTPIVSGDFRELAGRSNAPLTLVLVSDISRFRHGADSLRLGWGNMDAGIVSENISVFCAAVGLKTRPRAGFPGIVKLRELLKLNDKQFVLLNHPVGYKN